MRGPDDEGWYERVAGLQAQRPGLVAFTVATQSLALGGPSGVPVCNSIPRATAVPVEHLVRPAHGAACEGVRHFQPGERIQT